MRHPAYSRLTSIACAICLLLLGGCASQWNSKPLTTNTSGASDSTIKNMPTQDNGVSMASFVVAGGASGKYTISSTQATSKLRHGHKEFTIELRNAGRSIFLAFYGYNGPGSYTLTNTLNGGDIHIDLGTDAASWDLAMQSNAFCSLTISSDVPSAFVGIDRMKGTFSCPHIPSSQVEQVKQPITVSDGQFDVLIIVES